jgi:hypothetical protein
MLNRLGGKNFLIFGTFCGLGGNIVTDLACFGSNLRRLGWF